ncbi:(Lyso)-N-acylphosphatidylethanolamine lipase-like isoform X1 [Oppia nitens]|uniref:(Lyso)-N-acylphosphatidylethanolamine lipase-like isoform X1 n=1 Tax=Oppia nitens TaxID=1686743 RepID=UPI0023DCCB7D|nr:(Lyso)-N-acylphosphatidylethanolamine lipase-like isoform X1 [Oppia nitens]
MMTTFETNLCDNNLNTSSNDPNIGYNVITNSSRVSNWFRWRPTSPHELDRAESKVLSFLKNPFRTYYVDIGQGLGVDNSKIWTLEMTPEAHNDNESSATPLVLIHGFASAIGLWALNLDSLLQTGRKLYAFDLLGFGKSSRPTFDSGETAEVQMIDSIERWRKHVGLDRKFILLGHSFGAYLAASYTLQYPERVSHLILADPWGMPSLQMNQQLTQRQIPRPLWVKMVAKVVTMFTPLAGLRAAGPWGPQLIHKLRPDIKKKFEQMAGEGNADCFLEYIYHCNANHMPSGEMAFKSLSTSLGWARNPMIDRITELHPEINMTFIYGSRSWIDRQPGFQTKYLLGDRVNVEIIQGSGHHVYADKSEEFNELVAKVCHTVDSRVNDIDINDSDDEDMGQALFD